MKEATNRSAGFLYDDKTECMVIMFINHLTTIVKFRAPRSRVKFLGPDHFSNIVFKPKHKYSLLHLQSGIH